jgi:hypothetical protein
MPIRRRVADWMHIACGFCRRHDLGEFRLAGTARGG